MIVGAGIAGISLYTFLDKGKFEVEIVEKRGKLENLGFAIILNPVGIRALRLLGHSELLIKNLGKSADGAWVWDKDGKLIGVTDFKPF